jgi:hypothetical protein
MKIVENTAAEVDPALEIPAVLVFKRPEYGLSILICSIVISAEENGHLSICLLAVSSC